MAADWDGKRVVILGAARQGLALARYLALHGALVVLNDNRPAEELLEARQALADLASVSWVFGGHPLDLLDGADLLCPSGGVPLKLPIVVEAQRRGIPLSNDSQIFLEVAPCKVIGITGSAGKTTTTTLVGRIAEQGRKPGETRSASEHPSSNQATHRVFVGGNIGTPLISQVDEMNPGDLVVMELSSFQLEQMTLSPQVAAVLNITPNHLDRHGTMEAYTEAKARILAFQTAADTAVLNREDPGSIGLAEKVAGRLVTFGISPGAKQAGTFLHEGQIYLRDAFVDTPIMPVQQIQLRGEHNLLNVLAACAICAAAGLSAEAMQAGVQGFTGVAHRLEFVRHWGGADWYNDSIATAPERSMAAIRSFTQPLVLLAGGRDKDLPWEDFAGLVRSRVDHLIVFGEAAGKIARAMGAGYPLVRCASLAEAVQAAANIIEPGDVVLLSPGGTSFDEFKDFEERGECFRQLVKRL